MKLFSFFKKKPKNVSDMSSDKSPDISYTSPDKSDTSEPQKVTNVPVPREDPLFSISRQLTQVQYELREVKPLIESSTQSLREDHYRILEEQVKSVEEYKKHLNYKRENLKQAKNRAEKELKHIEVDARILDHLSIAPKRTAEISDELKISRGYAAERVKSLLEAGQIARFKQGRKAYYKIPKPEPSV